MDLFLVRKVLTALVLPPTGPLVVALIGLGLLNFRPRLGLGLAWLGLLTLLALSLSTVSQALLNTLDGGGPLDFARARNAQAIVILGGGVRRNAPEYGGDTLGRLTLERVRYGALVARETRLPILVTGGVVYGGTAEATLMTRSLEEEFHIKVKWKETLSRNTHENAVRSAEILRLWDVRHVVLVAHSFDMPRAKAEFMAEGLEVVPAPTHIPSRRFDSPLELLPSVSSLQDSYYALYELLALAMWQLGI